MDATATDPITAALAPFSDRLRPESADQLRKIWKDDFEGLPPGVVADLVRVRVQSGDYNHFFAADTTTAEGRQVAALRRAVAGSGAGRNPLAGV